MKDYTKDIGKWLATQRKAKGLMQDDIGQALGVTKSAVHYWETGKRKIDANEMLNYCHLLGVDPQDLVRDLTHPTIDLKQSIDLIKTNAGRRFELPAAAGQFHPAHKKKGK